MGKSWRVIAVPTDPLDVGLMDTWNNDPLRFRFRRSAQRAAKFYERVLGEWAQFYVVRDEP